MLLFSGVALAYRDQWYEMERIPRDLESDEDDYEEDYESDDEELDFSNDPLERAVDLLERLVDMEHEFNRVARGEAKWPEGWKAGDICHADLASKLKVDDEEFCMSLCDWQQTGCGLVMIAAATGAEIGTAGASFGAAGGAAGFVADATCKKMAKWNCKDKPCHRPLRGLLTATKADGVTPMKIHLCPKDVEKQDCMDNSKSELVQVLEVVNRWMRSTHHKVKYLTGPLAGTDKDTETIKIGFQFTNPNYLGGKVGTKPGQAWWCA